MKDHKYYQLIPEKVLEVLSGIESVMSKDIKGFCSDNLKQIIHLVAYNTRKDKNATPLKMEYIKRYVAQGDKYLSGLIRLGIVDRYGYYTPGYSSYTYSFNKEYESKFISIPLTNPKLIRRIGKTRTEIIKEASYSIRDKADQTIYIRQLTMDDGYIDFIEKNYTSTVPQYNYAVSSSTRIINKDFYYKVDSTSYRFHSNVTNLPGELVYYLRVNGEPLANIDVKNCQPYLSILVLTNPKKLIEFAHGPELKSVLLSLSIKHSTDIQKYISLTVNGQLYEYLMNTMSIEGLYLDRDATKKQVLRALFAPNRMPKNPLNRKAREVFIKEFPNVHKIFSLVRGNLEGDKFTRHSRFSILLTRVETYIILRVIVKRIVRELPRTIVITKHDSVLTGIYTNNIEEVKQIMNEELSKLTGYPPKLKVEGTEHR